jgi:hypothetical protein
MVLNGVEAQLQICKNLNSGAYRDRTDNLNNAIVALYQLS